MAKEQIKLSEVSVLHLDAGHTPSGNPKRVYVLTHPTKGYLAAVDEGYNSWGALKEFGETAYPVLRANIQGRINVPHFTYREFVKLGTDRMVDIELV